MTSLDFLKYSLRRGAESSQSQPLSEVQYGAGFDVLVRGWEGSTTYQDFITPHLSELIDSLLESRSGLSMLEIGPGPQSVLGSLPRLLRRKIKGYTAYEPNHSFASTLEEWCHGTAENESPFPSLDAPPHIHKTPFETEPSASGKLSPDDNGDNDSFDMILFCHSLYGLKPKETFIERALELLVKRPEGGGMVVVFHRDGTLQLDGLVCHRTATYPTGLVHILDEDESLDGFARFIAGFSMVDPGLDDAIRTKWRETCRVLGRREEAHSNQLSFAAPNIMLTFNHSATKLPELMADVPFIEGERTIKNVEARLRLPVPMARPTNIHHIQQCVRWALKHNLGLTVLSGGHSGQCVAHNTVCIDMAAFDQVHILKSADDRVDSDIEPDPLVIAEAGCRTGDIVRKAMAEGITVPLGARPSVGAGLWLQGGIGHLARAHGLTCDSIIGAVFVSVKTGQILCVGSVPTQYQPIEASRPENEKDLLWALRGAGSNFGIVISVTFRSFAAPTYLTHSWIVPLSDKLKAPDRLKELDKTVAKRIPRNSSIDVYLYSNDSQLHLGVTLFETSTSRFVSETSTPVATRVNNILGLKSNAKVTDSVGLFETELYVSGMHGGHGGGKTSSFKRCVFLTDIGAASISGIMIAAIDSRPSPLCYIHLLQGGGAVADMAEDATAFGCRDWDFACVVTGVWPRDLDGPNGAQAAVRWVYRVVEDLLPFSRGIYAADLGPDPRDARLAAVAFGVNSERLVTLKEGMDPQNVLASACPLRKAPKLPKVIILVTGRSGAGKDYCAGVWATTFAKRTFTAKVVSISDETKREYAAHTGANIDRLLNDRDYKEQHRPALTGFFRDQVLRQPHLPKNHFLRAVHGTPRVDVLLITGMRDEAPVATFSHLVPYSRLIDLRVERSNSGDDDSAHNERPDEGNDHTKVGNEPAMDEDYRPDLLFNNNAPGSEAATKFVETHLLTFLDEDFQRLGDMVLSIPNFPRPALEFRHVLGIAQKPGGLGLCTSLLQSHFAADWSKVGAVVGCESGGFIFASALAVRVDVPFVMVRKAGKLPPPTISVVTKSSHISSANLERPKDEILEMECGVLAKGTSVMVVDDALASGMTLCAVLELLVESGIRLTDISVIAVAEFPIHRGRKFLRQRGFGMVRVNSLLVFGCA